MGVTFLAHHVAYSFQPYRPTTSRVFTLYICRLPCP